MKNSLKIVSTVFFLLFLSNAYSLPVNQNELESAGTIDSVSFESYSGPHKIVESADTIRGIGSSLGTLLATPSESVTLSLNPKYTVVHAVDPNETQKLDADIFIVNSTATVDHIDNLRRIISGFLVSAYGYSQKDADTLSVFITVYNAVYRSKMDFWNSRYKDVVTKNLTQEKAGLALSYTQWPGATQIVIPLGEVVDGGLSTVDTSAISDKNVISSMQEDNDKGIDARKDLVNIKEREAEIAAEKAVEAKKTETESQKALENEQAKLPELKRDAALNPEDENKQKTVRQSEDRIQKLKEEIAASAQKAKEQQAKADKKSTEAVSERSQIAGDQQKIVNAQDEQIVPVFALKLSNEEKQLSKLVKINSLTGKTLKESPVTMIHSRTFYKTGDKFLAIAGQSKGNAAVKLVLLDSEKMDVTSQSEEDIAENSVLVKINESYLCVISENKKYYIGKFDEKLNLICKSETAVNKATPITVLEKTIYVTNDKGSLIQLSADDLKEL